jgi:hypothetical protein
VVAVTAVGGGGGEGDGLVVIMADAAEGKVVSAGGSETVGDGVPHVGEVVAGPSTERRRSGGGGRFANATQMAMLAVLSGSGVAESVEEGG